MLEIVLIDYKKHMKKNRVYNINPFSDNSKHDTINHNVLVIDLKQ